MPLHTLILVQNRTSKDFFKDFVETSGIFAPITFTDSVTQAIEFIQNTPVQIVLIEKGIKDGDKDSILSRLPQNTPALFFAGDRPLLADPIELENMLSYFSTENPHYSLSPPTPNSFHNFQESTIFVKSDSAIWKINLQDLVCAEAQKDYVMLHTHQQSLRILSSMKHVQARLPSSQFFRVHRSFIIRLDKIESIENDVIRAGGFKVPIGPSYRQELMGLLNFI